MQKGRDGSNPRLKVMGPRGGPGKVRRVGGCDRMKRIRIRDFVFVVFTLLIETQQQLLILGYF